jgi:hypothetical protein
MNRLGKLLVHTDIAEILWYFLVFFITLCIIFVWIVSFSVPSGVDNPFQWIIENKLGLFVSYVIFGIGVLIVFILIACATHTTITFTHPLTYSGIFLYAVSVLLLSSFFTTSSENTASRFYDTHPLIFCTAAIFLGLGIIAAIVSTVKTHVAKIKERNGILDK